MPESNAVQTMFGGIASRYDLANHALSLGTDFWWRHRLVRDVAKIRPRRVLDLATGSGDVAFALKKRLGEDAEVRGGDFCQPMLDEAQEKKKRDPNLATIPFEQADVLNLPYPDSYADAITIAFGIRNLEDRQRGLREMRRVLRPGGALFVLEFTQPDPWFRPVYFFYLKAILPGLARLLTGDRSAYEYLGGSIAAFPTRQDLKRELHNAEFKDVIFTGLTAGIVAIHRGISS